MKSTTIKPSTTTTITTEINADDITVTKVFGRYMSVDTKQLLRKDELLKNKKLKAQQKPKKIEKKHFIPMSLLKPQPPTLVDEKIKVDIPIDVPSSSSNGQHTPTEYDDPSELDAMEMYARDEDLLTTKELIDDMARIMKNGAQIRRNRFQYNKVYAKKNHGACFTGADSFFHYNDAETMRQIISYKIDLNLRFKTHSNNGLILWSGRHTSQPDDDYLLLGIENG